MINLIKKYVNVDSIVVKNNEIDATDLDEQKVMMNLDKGQYFMMNEIGSRIWDIIVEPISVKEIVNNLMAEYDVEEKICKTSVLEFLESLNNAELISIK